MTGIILITEDTITIDSLLNIFQMKNLPPFEHIEDRYVVNTSDGREYVAVYNDSEGKIKSEYSAEELGIISETISKSRMFLLEYSSNVFLKEVLSLIADNASENALIEYENGFFVFIRTFSKSL